MTESYFIITHTKLRSFQFISFHCILCHSILRFGSTVSHLRRSKDRKGGVLSVQNTEIMMCHSCFPRHNNMFPHSGLRPQGCGVGIKAMRWEGGPRSCPDTLSVQSGPAGRNNEWMNRKSGVWFMDVIRSMCIYVAMGLWQTGTTIQSWQHRFPSAQRS